jgi:hypothetical protein
VILVIGLALLIFGLVEATPSDQVAVGHFAPSPRLGDVFHDGTRIESSSGFPGCPNSDVLGGPVYAVTWPDGDRDVTIRVGDQIGVGADSNALYLPGGDSLCFVQSAGGYGGQVDTFQAVHQGSQVVFENRTTKIEVIKITVLAVPTNVWAVALMGVGGVLVVGAVAMLWVVCSRRFRSRPPTPPSEVFERQRVYT